jgi:hypothetical protein
VNPWLRTYYQRLRAAGKRPKMAMIAAMHKLVAAIYSVAMHRRLFISQLSPYAGFNGRGGDNLAGARHQGNGTQR